MLNFSHFNSLISLFSYFNSNKVCIRFLERNRWDMDTVCPYCGSHHCCHRGDGRWRCEHCNKSFSVLVGTIFENTKIPLQKWFAAMYLESSHSNGISSCQVAKDINVTQKTAWFMLHKIRTLYRQNGDRMLCGMVECDEMYSGGRETNKHLCKKVKGTQGTSTKTKTPIFGMVEYRYTISEKGKKIVETYVKVLKMDRCVTENILTAINASVEKGSHITTDESSLYFKLTEFGYIHDKVRHKDAEFAVGNVTTNHIEGFWAGFRRMVGATYHYVSKNYLQRYIDEACFRYNNRNKGVGERFEILLTNSLGKVDYDMVRCIT